MRFLIAFLATTLLTAIAYFALALALTPAPIAAEYWVREMILIKRDIAKHYAGQRKIIFAAGSSSLFGIDAQQLGNELHIPVINFGLHGALSLPTILGEAAAAAEPGDVVLLPLEDAYYCAGTQTTPWQARNVIAWNPERWASWSVIERIQAIRLFNAALLPELVQAKLRQAFLPQTIHDRLATLDDASVLAQFSAAAKPATFAYSAYNLDKLGDMQLNDGAHFQQLGRRADAPTNICPGSMELLQSFVARMQQKQVRTYFAHSPYIEMEHLDQKQIQLTSDQFVAQLSTIAPVLDSKPQLVFARKYFFDTEHHLNAEGRKIRTEKLADSIRSNAELNTYLTQLRR